MTQRATCPKCSHQRRGRNRNDKCLKVFDNGNEFCHHCGYDSTKDKSEWVPSPDYKPYKKPCQDLPQTVSEAFRQEVSNRGISWDVIKRNKISWNGKEIMFPYFYDGEIFNIKYRDLNKKFRQEAGAMKGFYGLDDIIGKKDIYIVEGEWDKASCEEAGFLNVVSVPDGAPSVNAKDFHTKFEFIDNWMHILDEAERIIIAVDNDDAGHKLEQELIRRFDPERCFIVRWPEGCKDANDVLVSHGILTLMGCLDEPKRVPIEGIFQASDFEDAYNDLYENGMPGGVKTGWPELDENYTVKPGDLCIVTGRPSHGKSTWLSALLVNLANIHSWKFGVFTPENQPLQRYMAILAQLYIGKPFKKGFHERMTVDETKKAFNWINKHFFFIHPPDEAKKVIDLVSKAKSLVKMYGVNGVVFDPWNEIDPTRSRNQTETEHISESLSLFKAFAQAYLVSVWVVAHPNKPLKEPGGNVPVPNAYDISGSAHWYNKADDIICVWRDPLSTTEPSQVHIQKIRFAEVGVQGKCYFHHSRMTGRFIAASKPEDVTAVQEKPPKKEDNSYFANKQKGQKDFAM